MFNKNDLKKQDISLINTLFAFYKFCYYLPVMTI